MKTRVSLWYFVTDCKLKLCFGNNVMLMLWGHVYVPLMLYTFLTYVKKFGESGLVVKVLITNRKVSGSNATRPTAGLKHPTSQRASWCQSGQNLRTRSDLHRLSLATSSIRIQTWPPWDSLIADKKKLQ